MSLWKFIECRILQVMRTFITMPSFRHLQNDALSGVVVFLVALPLCMGIALASGAPVMSGLIAGIIGGLVISVFSASDLSVSGPAAGLTAVVLSGIATLGSFEAFLAAIVVAGLLQICLGFLRLGSLTEFIPNGVIRGMLAGIGVVIIYKQVEHLLGWDKIPMMDGKPTHVMDGRLLVDFLPHPATVDVGVLLIGLLCLAMLIVMDQKFVKSFKAMKLIPSSLIVVTVGTVFNELLVYAGSPLGIEHGSGHLVDIPLLSQNASFFTSPDFSVLLTNPAVWITAVTIAVIASVETLLCIEATEKIDPEKRFCDNDRELIAQGIGNTLSGLIGGLPITSVIVRTSTNVYAGAKTRLSALVHGLLLLAAVVVIPELLNRVPIACLAAVLIMVGYKLTSLQIIRESWEHGIDQFLPFTVTIIGIVFTDLLVGIGLGLLSSMYWVVKANRFVAISTVVQDNHWLIRFNKDASFINKSELKRIMRRIPENVTVIFDATRASVVDHDIYDTIGEFAQASTYRNVHVEYINLFGKRKV